MPQKKSADEYISIIKKNHQDYLNAQMVTHLSIMGAESKKALIDRYLSYIKSYRVLKKDELDDDIRGPSIADKAKRGAISALIGMAVGAFVFTKEQSTPSVDMFGAKAAVQGGFAAAIGVSCGALIYATWDISSEKPAHADLDACKEEMKKAGFTEEKYAKLSENLVKLFHYRECLLLKADDKDTVNMRSEFKSQYFSSKPARDFDESDFNLAVEVYFLEELNALFYQTFQKINQVHDQEIQDEKQANKFMQWMKKHFDSDENRNKFTQQMQIEFMKECIRFLEKAMYQPSFIGQYTIIPDLIAGLVIGALAVGFFAVTTVFMPVFALICVGIVAGTLAAIGTHMAITQSDELYYKRDKVNRDAIQAAIKNVALEQKRLNTLIQKVVVTTKQDLAELKKYNEDNKSGIIKTLKGDSKKHIAQGSVKAWIREYASRFTESKTVEIDLPKRIEALINMAQAQTDELQTALSTWMESKAHNSPVPDSLTQFINDTMEYLEDPEHADFIETFESVQKIKEQVLEIVGGIPCAYLDKPLPKALINFYIAPVLKGGLGGLKSDLDQVRRLAPVVADRGTYPQHPYQLFLTIAAAIDFKLKKIPKGQLIFYGDSQYRKMLGLSYYPGVHIEDKINDSNIEEYLNNSFDFLCLLNQYETSTDWKTPFKNNDAFILYRMLLVKQLANLTDPNNIRVDYIVKETINAFARTKLNYNPDVAFDDILHQALLITPDNSGGVIKDPLDNFRSITELSYIADAIRVDMAYVSNSLSAEQLITFEANQFLLNDAEKIIFGHNATGKLLPECSDYFYTQIEETITTSTAFIALIKQHALLKEIGTIEIFLQIIASEINTIQQQTKAFISFHSSATTVPFLQLEQVITNLEAFKQAHKPINEPSPVPIIAATEVLHEAAPAGFGIQSPSQLMSRFEHTFSFKKTKSSLNNPLESKTENLETQPAPTQLDSNESSSSTKTSEQLADPCPVIADALPATHAKEPNQSVSHESHQTEPNNQEPELTQTILMVNTLESSTTNAVSQFFAGMTQLISPHAAVPVPEPEPNDHNHDHEHEHEHEHEAAHEAEPPITFQIQADASLDAHPLSTHAQEELISQTTPEDEAHSTEQLNASTACAKHWEELDHYIEKQERKLASSCVPPFTFFHHYSAQDKLNAAKNLKTAGGNVSGEIYTNSHSIRTLIEQHSTAIRSTQSSSA